MLPNAERAVVSLSRLRTYTLNPIHGRGRHKARGFRRRLRLTERDAELVRDALLAAIHTHEAIPGVCDEHGQRYSVQFLLRTHRDRPRAARVHSAWIIRPDEDFPRFLTAYLCE